MTHDDALYHEPEKFNPDRYLPKEEGGHGEPYPVGPFGFGRRCVPSTFVPRLVLISLSFLVRVCIGRVFADNSIWMMVTTMLATLNLGKKVDRNGRVVEPRVKFTNGGTW